MKTVRIISDLHIGVDDGADDFNLDEKEFIRFCREWLERGDSPEPAPESGPEPKAEPEPKPEQKGERRLVVAGDGFECWESGAGSPESALRSIRANRPELFAFLTETPGITLINGNHDAILRTGSEDFGAVEELKLDYYGWLLYLAHGHQSDGANSEKKCGCFGRMVAWCVGNGERLIDPDLDVNLEALAEICGGTRDPKQSEEHARKVAQDEGYDFVGYGHTHVAKVVQWEGGVIYASSGKCRDRNGSLDVVDVEATPTSLSVVATLRSVKTGEVLKTYGSATREKIAHLGIGESADAPRITVHIPC